MSPSQQLLLLLWRQTDRPLHVATHSIMSTDCSTRNFTDISTGAPLMQQYNNTSCLIAARHYADAKADGPQEQKIDKCTQHGVQTDLPGFCLW